MGIPPRFSRNVVALHGFVARINIFKASRQNVVNTRPAVCRGRSFVEGEERLSLRLLKTALEDVLFSPEGKNIFLELRPVVTGIDFTETHNGSRF